MGWDFFFVYSHHFSPPNTLPHIPLRMPMEQGDSRKSAYTRHRPSVPPLMAITWRKGNTYRSNRQALRQKSFSKQPSFPNLF